MTQFINYGLDGEKLDREEVKKAWPKIKENIVPKSVINDALHLAIAVVYNLDLIVSWNLKHIVKLKTRLGANAINLRNNYKTIEIATPEEVVEND